MSMLQKLRRKAAPVAAVVVVAASPAIASANGNEALTKIGTDIAAAVGNFVTIISAIGMAGISVVVMITAFKMGFSFVKGMK